MIFYEHGKENKKAIMLLPGNMMTHRQFEVIVPMLKKEYHIICVSFDGYDETGKTTYTTAKEQAEKLATYIENNLNGRIDLIFAESLGSAPALFLTRNEKLSIGGIIINGAQYLNMGIFNKVFHKISSKMAYKMLSGMKEKGTLSVPKFLLKKFGREENELKFLSSQLCLDATEETIKSTFGEGIVLYKSVEQWRPNTKIPMACWFGTKERNMKKAVKNLKRAFPNIEIKPFDNIGHGGIINSEELLIKELKAFMKKLVCL